METYIKFKFITDYVLPFVIVVTISLCIGICGYVVSYKKIKRTNYMKKHGFTRYIQTMASYGTCIEYGYKKDNIRVLEKDLFKMKMRDIKKYYK